MTNPMIAPPPPARGVCRLRIVVAGLGLAVAVAAAPARAEGPLIRSGDPVPRDVREIYEAGIRYLLGMQDDQGAWRDDQPGPGVTGLAVMVLLASGEDPNFGPFRTPIRRALRNIISLQQPSSGFLGGGQGHDSMYQHGFAMLALAEAYGVVDDRQLWSEVGVEPAGRSLGQALELAVRCAVTSARQNPVGAWRYSPEAKDADTSVSGAVLMGLLAARNAGIAVPDDTVDRAIEYFAAMTGANGQVGYSGSPGGGSDAVTAIAVLVLSIAHRRELPQYRAAAAYLESRSGAAGGQPGMMDGHPGYTPYYRAQALFQSDVAAWERWNALLVKDLKSLQSKEGGFPSGRGQQPVQGTHVTALHLLSLAVNYRFLPVYER